MNTMLPVSRPVLIFGGAIVAGTSVGVVTVAVLWTRFSTPPEEYDVIPAFLPSAIRFLASMLYKPKQLSIAKTAAASSSASAETDGVTTVVATVPLVDAKAPPIRAAVVKPFTPDFKHVRKYCSLCRCESEDCQGGLPQGVCYLPVCYLEAMTFSLQISLLAHPRFPIAAIGTVHVRNTFVQTRPLRSDESFTMKCVMEKNLRVTSKGDYELDVTTSVLDSRNVEVYTNVAVFLIRNPDKMKLRGRKKQPQPTPASPASPKSPLSPTIDFNEYESINTLSFAEDTGRKFAALCKDYNLIHIWRWTARLFGYRRPIAHGMCMCAAILGSLDRAQVTVPSSATSPQGVTVNIAFTRPVLLPMVVEVVAKKTSEKRVKFALVRNAKDEQSGELVKKALMEGDITLQA